MLPPTDSTPSPSAAPVIIRDDAPQPSRDADVITPFVWRGQALNFSVLAEMYYRDLRILMNAPPLEGFRTIGDYQGEAPRIIYCAALSFTELIALRLKTPHDQITAFAAWVEKNIPDTTALLEAAKLANRIDEANLRAITVPAHDDDAEPADSGNSLSRPV